MRAAMILQRYQERVDGVQRVPGCEHHEEPLAPKVRQIITRRLIAAALQLLRSGEDSRPISRPKATMTPAAAAHARARGGWALTSSMSGLCNSLTRSPAASVRRSVSIPMNPGFEAISLQEACLAVASRSGACGASSSPVRAASFSATMSQSFRWA